MWWFVEMLGSQYIQACIFVLQCKRDPLFWAKGGEVKFFGCRYDRLV